MLHNFNLYNVLSHEATNEKMSNEGKYNMAKTIKKIDVEGCELLYAIIRCYQIEYETVDKNISTSLPYDGKVLKTCIKWDMDKFPNKLLNMIDVFLKKHVSKMNEEKVLRQTKK